MSFDGPQSFAGHPSFGGHPTRTAAALIAHRPVPPQLLGTRAALFHIWRGSLAKAATHIAEAGATKANPVETAPAPQSMVSGTVTARFAYEMPVSVGNQHVTSLPPDPAPPVRCSPARDTPVQVAPVQAVPVQDHPSAPETNAALIRQARLRQALLDDMFIF